MGHRVMIALLGLLCAATLAAQGTGSAETQDPTVRLREVLPAADASRVLSIVERATANGLPGIALAQRALKFAARGVPSDDIVRAVGEQAARQAAGRALLDSVRAHGASGDEVEAAAEALREGVSGPDVSTLAKSAPSGRSLVVPLYVLGSLTARGLPSDQALQRVQQRLAARASDADLESLPQQAENARNGTPGAAGRAIGLSHHPSGESPAGAAAHGGPPPGVPANPVGHRPATTPAGPPNHPGKP